VLKAGDAYAVFNVQALAEPVAEGRFTGQAVLVPTLRSAIAPQFEAYLVVKR
jgi:hypothetical protein